MTVAKCPYACENFEVPAVQSEAMWRILGDGKSFVTNKDGRPFHLARDGEEATLKIDAFNVLGDRVLAREMYDLYAGHPCIEWADTIAFVPNGAKPTAMNVGHRTGKPVVCMRRPPDAPKHEMYYQSQVDSDTVRAAGRICIIEDVLRTGYSTELTALKLWKINPELEIHSLSAIQRAEVDPRYMGSGITFHTFVRRDIPMDVAVFRQQYPTVPVHAV